MCRNSPKTRSWFFALKSAHELAVAEGVDIDCSDAFSCTGLFWAAVNRTKIISSSDHQSLNERCKNDLHQSMSGDGASANAGTSLKTAHSHNKLYFTNCCANFIRFTAVENFSSAHVSLAT